MEKVEIKKLIEQCLNYFYESGYAKGSVDYYKCCLLYTSRQEKVVIQDCLLLPASVLLYGYLSGISFLFYPAFPPKN